MYKGVKELEVRRYDGNNCWTYCNYAIGITLEDAVYDYKTGEKYDVIPRDDQNHLKAKIGDITVGQLYAIESSSFKLKKDKYSHFAIDRYINDRSYYTSEYKKMKRFNFKNKK